MKLTIRLPIVMTTSGLVLPMVEAHIIQAAQDVLDALPDEIERLNKLGSTEIAQKLADLQDTLREAEGEPEEPAPLRKHPAHHDRALTKEKNTKTLPP